MKNTIAWSVKPIILGDRRVAIKLSLLLFFKHWLRATVFGRRRLPSLVLQLFAKYRRIPDVKDEFLIMTLERFAEESCEWSTLLLIPTTEEYRCVVNSNRGRLEQKYIIRTPESIMESDELFPVAQRPRKEI